MPRVTSAATEWSTKLDDHVSALALSPDGRQLVAGSLGGDCLLLDATSGSTARRLPDHPFGVLSAAWKNDGSRFATSGSDGVLRLYDAVGAPVSEHHLGGWVDHLSWSPVGHLAATAGRHVVVITDSGTALRSGPLSSTASSAAWASNGTRVGVTSYGGVSWFDVDKQSFESPSRHHEFRGSPLTLALAPNGRWACAGYQDASIHVWPLWSGDDLAMSGYPAKIDHLAFRPDGHWLVAACLTELTWWDFSGKGPRGKAPATGADHTARVTWLAWQGRGELLASGDQAGVVLVWPSPRSVRDSPSPVHVIGGDSAIGTGCWTDGSALCVGRQDGRIELVRFA